MNTLKIIDRDGKASLWVDDLNIWDLPHKQVTQDVLKAIRSAYERGRQKAIREIENEIWRMSSWRIGGRMNPEWIDERKNA